MRSMELQLEARDYAKSLLDINQLLYVRHEAIKTVEAEILLLKPS